MERASIRYVMASVFLLFAVGPYYLEALTDLDLELRDALGVPLIVGVFLVTGFVVGRWWALALPVIAYLLALPLGVDTEDSDQWTYAWLLLWGPLLIATPCLFVGLVARLLLAKRGAATTASR